MARPRQTHCKRGHEFTPDNTIRHRIGKQCRFCTKANFKIRYNNDAELRARLQAASKAYKTKLRAAARMNNPLSIHGNMQTNK
jgi:hypothetical protein